jgi:hypothetical protein
MEYSRNLIFLVGGRMEQVFQALIDRSRAPLNLKTIKTILGDKGRPKYRNCSPGVIHSVRLRDQPTSLMRRPVRKTS